MAKFYPLFSSSSGNAHYIGGRNAGILVDAGVSCKRILEAIDRNGLQPGCIQGIFITHTHSDHIKGVRVLAGKLKIPIYGTSTTLAILEHDGHLPAGTEAIPVGNLPVCCGNCEISAFPTSHDAPGSCGYRIHTQDDKYCAVCTDLGVVTQTVWDAIEGCDMVLLESNYEPRMLRSGPYPPELKRRIMSERGHLSNPESAGTAKNLVKTGTTRILLGHLSPHNNTPQLAAAAAQKALSEFKQGFDYELGIAPAETPGGAVIF